MSPEFRKNGKLVADLPDRSGTYITPLGNLTVDLSLLHPNNTVNEVVVSGDLLKGRPTSRTKDGTRNVQVNRGGVGAQELRKGETFTVKLHDRSLVAKPVKPWRSALRRHRRGWTW